MCKNPKLTAKKTGQNTSADHYMISKDRPTRWWWFILGLGRVLETLWLGLWIKKRKFKIVSALKLLPLAGRLDQEFDGWLAPLGRLRPGQLCSASLLPSNPFHVKCTVTSSFSFFYTECLEIHKIIISFFKKNFKW